jgi:hypothetical protein
VVVDDDVVDGAVVVVVVLDVVVEDVVVVVSLEDEHEARSVAAITAIRILGAMDTESILCRRRRHRL